MCRWIARAVRAHHFEKYLFQRHRGCALCACMPSRRNARAKLLNRTLRHQLPAPCLGILPHGVPPQDAAAHLDLTLVLE